MKAVIQLVLLVFGIIYIYRRFRIMKTRNETCPSASAEQFTEWKSLALRNNTMFLCCTWGLFILLTPIAYNAMESIPLFGGLLPVGILYLSWVALAVFIVKSWRDEKKIVQIANDAGISLYKKLEK